MISSLVKIMIGSVVGAAAIYVTGKITFKAGYDIANAENHYARLMEESEKIEKKLNTVSEKTEKGRLFGTKLPVIGRLIRDPESHQANISIEDGELRINVKPRRKENVK